MSAVARNLAPTLRAAARQYPVVTLTGPRQSGKTTLCRAEFPDHAYVNLERLDLREYARSDPRGFLDEHGEGAILDEVQHVPELLSWLQVEVDERPDVGRFVLTGSQQFGLTQAITQSLAGRTAVLHLLPLALDELQRFDDPPDTLLQTLLAGAYPRVHDRGLDAQLWHAGYITTYVERDVRQIKGVGDLEAFAAFVQLAAGRTAQTVNLTSLGGDAGVTHNTARSWLSVLEASYLVHRLPPWHRNLKKRVTKAPKLHFIDSGLLCHLLGIRSVEALRHHPLRGAIFESWAVSEVLKARRNAGLSPRLFHFRDHKGLEVDLIVELAEAVALVEAKSGATVAADFFEPLRRLVGLAEGVEWRPLLPRVVYGGLDPQRRSDLEVVPWRQITEVHWD